MTDRPAILNAPEAWAVVPVEPVGKQWRYKLSDGSCSDWRTSHAILPFKLDAEKERRNIYASPDPNALQEVVEYVDRLEAENTELRGRFNWDKRTYAAEAKTMQAQARAEAAEARVKELEARLAEAVKVIEPFAAFSQVIDTAEEERGYSKVVLYAGEPPLPNGWINRADEGEVEIDSRLEEAACLFGAVGSWEGIAASFMCPVIQAEHLRAARTWMEGK